MFYSFEHTYHDVDGGATDASAAACAGSNVVRAVTLKHGRTCNILHAAFEKVKGKELVSR